MMRSWKDDDWAWGMCDEEADDWISLRNTSLTTSCGGCVDATSSAEYGDQAHEVDKVLAEVRARRGTPSHMTAT